MRPAQRRIVRALVAAACLSLATTPSVAQTPADQSFWDSIKNSTNIAEFRAYLEAFPRGHYAAQARSRIGTLQGQPNRIVSPQPSPGPSPGPSTAPPSTDIPFNPQPSPPPPANTPPPPPAANPNASVLTSYQTIREVQDRLYALNYDLKVLNGQLSRETREAIKAWQQVVRRPVTGDITADDLAFLRRARPIQAWGAIGFEARGAYGIVWNRTSRQDAETDAMAECRKHAAANGKNCQVFTLGDSQCGAMSWYQGTAGGRNHWGAFVVRRATFGQARDDGLEECRRQAKVPRACQVRVTFCADGAHKR